MQLQNLVKPLADMSDDELRARVQEIRHNRTTVRPAAKARVKKAAKKGGATRINKAEAMLSGMSDAQREQLILMLGGGKS